MQSPFNDSIGRTAVGSTPAPAKPPPAGGTADVPDVRQFSRAGVLTVWAAAAVPMGLLAWVVVPAVAGSNSSPGHFAVTLLTALTIGLIWQAVLVVALVARERRDPSWTSLRDSLWLRSPRTATRRGGRLWWWVAVYGLALGALDMLPFGPPIPHNRDLGLFLASSAGHQTFHHAWGLYALVAVELLFNTVLGEELLFRGLLLPRMRASFGRADWVVNGVLFGLYHVHEPWVIPNAILTGFLCAHPTRRLRSAWMGIAIHSVEAVFFLSILLPIVMAPRA